MPGGLSVETAGTIPPSGRVHGAWEACERGACMSEERCAKCNGEMVDGTAGVSALRIWYRPDKWSICHASFRLTASHVDVVRAKACTGCGYLESYVDPDYLRRFIS